jgi:hypothetical protein
MFGPKPGNFWEDFEQSVPTENAVSTGVLLFLPKKFDMGRYG